MITSLETQDLLSGDETALLNSKSIVLQAGYMGSLLVLWTQTLLYFSLYFCIFFFTMGPPPPPLCFSASLYIFSHIIILVHAFSIKPAGSSSLVCNASFVTTPHSRCSLSNCSSTSVDVVGSWTDTSDVKDRFHFCPTGSSLNYWCK